MLGMSQPPGEPVSRELIADWHLRVERLERVISKDPAGEWAWLWRTRRDILMYLLGRFDAEVVVRPTTESEPVPPPTPPVDTARNPAMPSPAGETLDAYVRPPPPSPLVSSASTGTGGKDVRGILRRLEAANRDSVYVQWLHERAVWERENRRLLVAERKRAAGKPQTPAPSTSPDVPLHRARNTSYPADGFALPGDALRDEERRVMQAEADAINALIDDIAETHHGSPLSEDEVAAILGGADW